MGKHAKLLTLCLTAWLLATTPLSAQTAVEAVEKPVEAERPNFSPVMPVKIKPRQGGADSISKAAADIEQENTLNPDTLGLYSTISEGSLGGTLWQNYPASDLSRDLSELDRSIASSTLRELLLRALLTTPDAATEGNTTGDVFSARLDMLIDMGHYDEAFRLYKKLEGNIPSPKAALAGAQGAFATGRTGLACLEEKALDDSLKENEDTSFWTDLRDYCTILLKIYQPDSAENSYSEASKTYASSKSLKSPSSLAELNDKSLIEIYALGKAGLLPNTLFSAETAKKLSPKITAFLLLQENQTEADKRLSLLVAGLEKGLSTKADLETAYRLYSKTPSAAPDAWKRLLEIYSQLQNSPDKAKLLKSSLQLSEKPDYAALQPFAPYFSGLVDTEAFTSEDARKVLNLLIRTGTRVSGAWLHKAFEAEQLKDKESVTDLEVIAAYDAWLKVKISGSSEKAKKEDNSVEAIEIVKLHALSLILSEEEAEDKVQTKSYENLLSLTAPNDYVMPSKEFMNNFIQASASQDIGKVILYSLQVLDGQRVSKLHPLVLYRIAEALKSVGLVEEIRSLAHEALADMIE